MSDFFSSPTPTTAPASSGGFFDTPVASKTDSPAKAPVAATPPPAKSTSIFGTIGHALSSLEGKISNIVTPLTKAPVPTGKAPAVVAKSTDFFSTPTQTKAPSISEAVATVGKTAKSLVSGIGSGLSNLWENVKTEFTTPLPKGPIKSTDLPMLSGLTPKPVATPPIGKPAPVDALTGTALNTIPFNDATRGLIASMDIGSGDLPKGVGGQTTLGSKGPTPITIDTNQNVNFKSVGHEVFNALFEKSGIDPIAFNRAWAKAAASNPDIKGFDNEINDSANNPAYHGNGENTSTNQYQLATERFALMGSKWGDQGLSSLPANLQQYYKAFLGEKQEPSSADVSRFKGQTIGEGSSTDQQANSLQDLLSHIGLPKAVVSNPITKTIGGAFDTAVDKVTSAIETVTSDSKDVPTSKKIGASLDAATSLGNLLLSPISAGFATAESSPVSKPFAKAVAYPFQLIQQVVNYGVSHIMKELPIAESTKQNLQQPISDVLGLIAQIYAGDLVAEKGIPLVKDKINDIKTTVHQNTIMNIIANTDDPAVVTKVLDQLKVPKEEQGALHDDLLKAKTVDEVKDVITGNGLSDGPREATIDQGGVLEGETAPAPEDLQSIAQQVQKRASVMPVEDVDIAKTETAPVSNYKSAEELIAPEHTDDIEFYKNTEKDIVNNTDKETARESAVSKIDEIMRTSGEEGLQMFKMVVDRFGKTDARKIFREGFATDTMTPKQMNNLFDSMLDKLNTADTIEKNLQGKGEIQANDNGIKNIAPEIDRLDITDEQKNALQAFQEGDTTPETMKILDSIDSKKLKDMNSGNIDTYANLIDTMGNGRKSNTNPIIREDRSGGEHTGVGSKEDLRNAQERELAESGGGSGELEKQRRENFLHKVLAKSPEAKGRLFQIEVQWNKLDNGEGVEVDRDTPNVLTGMGFPDSIADNVISYRDRGAFTHIAMAQEINGRKIFGAYGDDTLVLNNSDQALTHAQYTDDLIMPHETTHAFLDKLPRTDRKTIFQSFEDNDLSTRAWQLAKRSTFNRYYKATVSDIIDRVKSAIGDQDGEISTEIVRRAGFYADYTMLLKEYIAETSIESMTAKLSMLDDILRSENHQPLHLKAEDMEAVHENGAVVGEQSRELNSTNDIAQKFIFQTINNTLEYGRQEGKHSVFASIDERTPQEILADAEAKANEPKQQDRINGLMELVQISKNYNAYMKALTTDPAYKDMLLMFDKDLRDNGYQNFTDFYQHNKIYPPEKAAEVIPESSMKPIDEEIKKISVSNKEVPMSDEDKATLDEIKTQRGILEDMVDEHPGKKLAKFISRKEGVFEDFKDPSHAKNESERKSIEARNKAIVTAAENAFDGTQYKDQFDNPDVIRSAIDDFQGLKADLEETKQTERAFVDEERRVRNLTKDEVALEKEAKKKSVKEMPERVSDVIPPEARGGIVAPRLDFEKWKDKSMPALNRDTFERNLEKVAPKKDADALKAFIVDPVRENETNRIKFNNELKLRTERRMKELGITRNSTNDELIQKFGEGEISLTELQKLAPKKWGEIQQAADYFRKLYDQLLDQWNKVRKEYGYPAIPKRPDYFRHFNEINFFTKSYGLLSSKNELPTSIAGKTEFFKPGKPFSTAEMKRTGKNTSYSAIGGFNNYIESVSKQIYHINSIQRGRALEKYMENSAKVGESLGTPLHLPNVIANLHEYVNNGLAGKTHSLDRTLESQLGRPTIAAFHSLSKLIGKNIIVGNLSTALSHLVSLPLIGATTDKIPLVKGMMTTLTSPLFKGGFTNIDDMQSDFLVRRFPIEEIMPSAPKKAEQALSYIFTATDKFKSRVAVAGKYYEGISNGLSKAEAMKQADIYGGKVIGDYSLGQKPNLMNAKTMTLLAQFQLGLNDSISVLTHDLAYQSRTFKEDADGTFREEKHRWRVASKIIQFMIFSYLFNQLLKQIRGSGKGLDPIDLGLTLAGLNEEGRDQPFLKRAGLATSDVLGELPFTSMFTGNFPLASAFATPIGYLKSGNYIKAAESLAIDFLSPIGGGAQAQKTILGVESINAGETESRAQQAQALIFGPKATIENNKVSVNLAKTLKAAKTRLAKYDPSVVAEVQQVFDQAKAAGFGTQEADDAVSTLTDAQYKIYKAMKEVTNDQNNIDLESKILPIVKQANQLGFGSDEANALVDPLSDEEYSAYQSIKTSLYGANATSTEGTPAQEKASPGNRVSDDEKTYDQHSFINHIYEVAKALGTDPVTTFNDVFAGNSSYRIAGVENGQVIVVRAPRKTTDAIKASQGGATSEYKLDHTIPLEIGGNNGMDNLLLLPTGDANTPGTWGGNTATEDLLGNALANGTITGKQAREYIIRYKAGIGEKISDPLMKEYKEKYNSQPITTEQIRQALTSQ